MGAKASLRIPDAVMHLSTGAQKMMDRVQVIVCKNEPY
jgi:hypothetical protein